MHKVQHISCRVDSCSVRLCRVFSRHEAEQWIGSYQLTSCTVAAFIPTQMCMCIQGHHDGVFALVGTPERTQILLAATQTPLLSDPKWGVKLLPELCKVVLHLPSQARQVHAACLNVIRQPLTTVCAAVRPCLLQEVRAEGRQ